MNKFSLAIRAMESIGDVLVKDKQGAVMEIGYGVKEDNFFTYVYDDDLIKVYVDGKEILSFDRKSPILDMFESLIDNIREVSKEDIEE